MRGKTVAALLLATASMGAMRAAAQDYRAAAAAFDAELTLAERIKLQLRLIAGGYTPVVPSEHLGTRAFEAIKAYQRDIGAAPTGRFTAPVAERLRLDTQGLMRLWGFGWVEHPSRPLRIWAPLGLVGGPAPTRYGAHYAGGAGGLQLDLLSYPQRDLRAAYDVSMRDWERSDARVHYARFSDKDGLPWWAASVTTADGRDHYYRYVQDGDAVTGFALEWDNRAGNVHGERIWN